MYCTMSEKSDCCSPFCRLCFFRIYMTKTARGCWPRVSAGKVTESIAYSNLLIERYLMAAQLNPRLLTSYRNASRVTSGVVFVVGFLVLAGWLFNIPALKSVIPGLATMKANTALAFALAGISLWLASTKHENEWMDRIAKLCAALTILIGMLTLSEYVFSQDFGIDQLLFRDTLTAENAYPGRMSPVTALNFSVLGFALFILDRRQYWWPVEVFGLAALLISVLALIGYAYGVPSLYHFFPYSSIAIHTAFAFSILCVGILFARPEQGLIRIFSSDNSVA